MRRCLPALLSLALLPTGCGSGTADPQAAFHKSLGPTPTPTSPPLPGLLRGGGAPPPVSTGPAPTPVPGVGSPISAAPTPTPTPQPTPTPTPQPLPQGVVQQRVQGDLMVTVSDGRVRIANAVVSLRDGSGKLLTQHLSNSNGQALFSNAEVQGNTGVTVTVDAINDFRLTNCPLTLDPAVANDMTVPLSAFGKVSGVVTDSSGAPLYGAVVSDFKNSTMTDANGVFYLQELPGNSVNLRAKKLHFQVASRKDLAISTTANACGRLALTADPAPVRVLFDGSKAPFGGAYTLSSYFATLGATLKAQGMQVTFGGNATLDLSNVDILVIASPTKAYTQAEVTAINTWLQAGKKLIVLGEWEGYSGFLNSSLTFTGSSYNLAINQDLVKEYGTTDLANDASFFVVNNLAPHPITQQISALTLFKASSVQIPTAFVNAVDPNEPQIVAQTSANGLQVTAVNARIGLVGAALSGLGNVVVIGDTSLWSDLDSQGLNPPSANIFQQSNKAFASNVFQW